LSKDSLFKSATLLIAITMVSKLFGFGREMVVASLYGASAATDAWFVAAGVPTLLFSPVHNAISTVFIPVFDGSVSLGRAKALLFRFGALAVSLSLLLLVIPVWIFATQVVSLLAPGFEVEAVAAAASMVRVVILCIVFRVVSGIVRAVLHVNRNFLVPGAESIPYNIVLIAIAFTFYREWGIYALVWGTLIATAVQLMYKLPFLFKVSLPGKLTDPIKDMMREVSILLPPVILSSMSGQLKAMVDKMFASTLSAGSISYLNYAVLLNSLPTALLITTIITVMYPSIVSLANQNNIDGFRNTLTRAFQATTFLILPVTLGMIILARPIIEFVYMRGAFDATAVAGTTPPLTYFALGLPGMVLYLFMLRAMYALKDTRTPLLATAISFTINILLNWGLIGVLSHAGLALANSLALWFSGLFLYWRLRKRIGHLNEKILAPDTIRSLGAAVLMGFICYLSSWGLAQIFVPQTFFLRSIQLIILIGSSGLVYFAAARLLGCQGYQEALTLLKSIFSKFLPNQAA
jgi:putative peptidoglycan lipid II flippase